MKVHGAAAVRRGSEYLSEGIRRIRRGLPEEEPSDAANERSRAQASVWPSDAANDVRAVPIMV